MQGESNVLTDNANLFTAHQAVFVETVDDWFPEEVTVQFFEFNCLPTNYGLLTVFHGVRFQLQIVFKDISTNNGIFLIRCVLKLLKLNETRCRLRMLLVS